MGTVFTSVFSRPNIDGVDIEKKAREKGMIYPDEVKVMEEK